MNWDAIGAIGEIVGAAAVVATLAYLAIQIRSNTRIAKAATRHSIAETALKMGEDLVSDRSLAELFVADIKGDAIGEADRVRLLARNYIGMRHYENIFYQYRAGLLEDDEWLGFRNNLKAVLGWKSMQEYWANESHYYSADFRNEVERIKQEIDDSGGELEHQYVIPREDKGGD